MEATVFIIAAAVILAGAVGVVGSRNPVHSTLFLILTLLGAAALFVLQDAHFLAAVQVVVYAGAIVILFLFVIMLLGVDRAVRLEVEPIAGQRPLAVIVGVALAAVLLTVTVVASGELAGERQVAGERALSNGLSDVERLGRVLFSQYALAVQATAVLLTIAVVGAVVLTRRHSREEP